MLWSFSGIMFRYRALWLSARPFDCFWVQCTDVPSYAAVSCNDKLHCLGKEGQSPEGCKGHRLWALGGKRSQGKELEWHINRTRSGLDSPLTWHNDQLQIFSTHSHKNSEIIQRVMLTWGLTIRSTVATAWFPEFPTWGRAGPGKNKLRWGRRALSGQSPVFGSYKVFVSKEGFW
jgi:hypothetical protein